MSGNILFLGNEVFEIPPFFQTWPGDLGKKVHACSLRFSALKCGRGKKSLKNPFLQNLHRDITVRKQCDKDGA